MTTDNSTFKQFIERGYHDVGVHECEFVFLYTDLRTFGREIANFTSRQNFFQSLIDPMVDRGQTVLVPTFTYTSHGIFDVNATQSRLGALNKDVIEFPSVRRSTHPLFSVAALGPKADIVDDIGKSAFGADSVFERLVGETSSFLHVGRPVAIGNTIVHYIEQSCGATYRYNKAFPTKVYCGQQYLGTDYTAFLRRRDVDGCDFDFVYGLSSEELHEGLDVKEVGSNKEHTNLSCYSVSSAVKFLTKAFYSNPSVFIGENFMEYE
ncbi:AAC(3) family N-acetyltransferase [Novosphingopyxis sp. YJ-S2-01]|uniref:AAC(3) family N-acetyltransferase n=1 Tax=Novosphingopyxis sp. YJ-S2-01 TaxID=2794021 RepID=UPI0018DB8AD4|nr:AAC(3) family N-acetyltransferase [Novosphingopyxis sp. YJ-S2-01]MBH9538443.1 AAC(3) family N-acetyltransferase [Novosphingopyxis sp. YJ-S2-01]